MPPIGMALQLRLLQQCPGMFKARGAGRRHAVAVRAAATEASERRVVVTGLGVVSSVGQEVDEFYNNLLEGNSGISEITGFDASEFTTRIAGEIKTLNSSGWIAPKWERRLDPCIKYTLVAGKKALADAGIQWSEAGSLESLDRSRCGILIGSAMGGMGSFSTAVEALVTTGHRKMNPFCIPFAITNMGGAMLAMDLGFMGPNYSVSTACASGNYCIVNSVTHIKNGDADLMLAGASDASIIPSGIGGFIACKALSKNNADPQGASRPWDKARDGFVMGEGSGVLVLEEYEHAKARGARIYAEYVGGAFTTDAHHMTDPHPEGKGVKLALRKTLEQAGITAEDVTYVNAHGTSTQAGDMAEYRAIREVIPHDAVRINSTKSIIGHLLGGAAAVEAVATVKAVHSGWVHPTLNLKDPEEGVDPQIVTANVKQQVAMKVGLSNSFGFGGHNSCVAFKAME